MNLVTKTLRAGGLRFQWVADAATDRKGRRIDGRLPLP